MVTLAGTANAQVGAAGKLPSFDGPYVFPSDGRSFPWGLAAGDVNGDGTPDVAVAHTETNLVLGTTHTGQPGIVRIWQNTGLWDTDPGNGLVLPIDVVIAPNASPSQVALVDLDGDDDLDLVVTSGLAYMPDQNPTSRGVYTLEYRDGEFLQQLGQGKQYYPGAVRSLVVADFNNDGLPDIAAGTDPWEDSNPVGAVHFWENDPNNPGLFIDRGQIGTGHAGPDPAAGVVAGDFNRIAIGGVKLDVVSGNLANNDISLLTNVSSQSNPFNFSPALKPGCAGSEAEWLFRELAAAKLEPGIADWDIVAMPDADQRVFVLHGSHNGSFAFDCDPADGFDDVYPGCYQCNDTSPILAQLAGDVTIADLNGGTNPDIIATDVSDSDPRVVILLGKGDGTFQVDSFDPKYCPQVHQNAGFVKRPFNVLAVDLDQDGFDDIVTSNHGTGAGLGSISVLINELLVSIDPG